MVAKEYIEANELVRDSFALARQIFDSGYRPDVLLVLWRGGTPVGIVVHEFLLYKGIRTYHTAVKAESYTGIEERVEPQIEQLDAVLEHLAEDCKVLIIDDIFDTGRTVARAIELLRCKTRSVKVATLYVKQDKNETDVSPDFFLRTTDKWLVFPHELMDLSPAELRRKDPYVHALLA